MSQTIDVAFRVRVAARAGVLPCGASYLLLPATPETHRDLKLALFRGKAHDPARYVALSPVVFATRQELAAKLDRLAQKAGKKKKREQERDRSQANTHYTTGQSTDVITEAGKDRATFEFSRYVCTLGCARAHAF